MASSGQSDLFDSPEDAPEPGKEALGLADLSRDTFDVLVFAAMQYQPAAKSKVSQSLPSIGLRNEAERRFTQLQVKEALQLLVSKGWLELRQQGYLASAHWRTRIFAVAFGDPEYHGRAVSIAEWMLMYEYDPRYSYYASPLKKQIRLELLLYLGRGEEALEIVKPKYGLSEEFKPSLAFLIAGFDAEKLRKVSAPLLEKAVADYLEMAFFDLFPPEPAWETMADTALSPELVSLAGSVHFLRGEEAEIHERIDELRDLAAKLKKTDAAQERVCLADARALEASLDFAKGKIDEAIGGFEESILIEKGTSRKMKFCPRWIGGLIFQLALCLRGEAGDIQRAYQIGKWSQELDQTDFSGYGHFGNLVADCVVGDTRQLLLEATIRNEDFLGSSLPNLNSLLFAIVFRLAGAKPAEVTAWEKKMGELADLATERGYGWLAMEAAAFSAMAGDTAGNRERAETLAAKCGIENAVPFSDRLAAPEAWEAQLKAMEAVAEKYGQKAAAKTSTKSKGARKELIWHLRIVMEEDIENHDYAYPTFGGSEAEDDDPDENFSIPDFVYQSVHDQPFFFDLRPIERSVSKTGRATKGRPVSLKKLHEDSGGIPHLTDQDRAVAKFIRKQRNWGGHAIYTLEDPRALIEVAGHPLLFADAEASRPLTLTRERIRVEVSEDKKNQITLRLVPPLAPGDEKAKLVEVGPDQYRIYEITKAVAELANAFEEESLLKLPGKAKTRLMNAISTLAGDLEIGAEGKVAEAGDSAEFRQVEGDATPRLRLVPEGEGLRVRMRVRPIATSDFTFPPGEGKAVIFGFDGDERVQAKRSLKEETKRATAVVEACPTLARHRGESPDPWEWLLDSPLACLELLRDLHALREGDNKDAPAVVLEWPEGEPVRLAGVVSAGSTTVSLGGSADWLTLSGEVRVSEDLVFSMRKLLEFSAASSRRGFIEIEDGKFVALTEEFQRQIDDLRVLSQPGKDETIKLPPLGALALEDFIADAQPASGTKKSQGKLWREWIDRFRDAREHRPDVPAGLQTELRPYQLDGYRWLSRLAKTGAGACLADDMGLGKTVQALALLLERAPLGPSLVVAPTSVAANWLDEAVKFAPTLNPVVFGDAGDRAAQLAGLGPRDLVICTYGLLARETEALSEVEWSVIVLDEAQAIKNSATQRSKSARNLRGAFKVVTTGTPVENRLSELHTLFQFLLPGFLGSWERFRKQFADPIERDQDAAARAHLRRLIQPFLLRRLKSSVLRDLPERTEINLHVDLSEEETAFYEALRQRAVEGLEEGAGEAGAIQILAELTRLRRACCHPVLVDKKAGATMNSSKLAAFSETLDELLSGGHKVLVFSQFVDHLSLVRAELDRKEISYQYLDGSTSKPKRKQAVDAFQRGEGEVFLISLKAGGFGLNLTAADYVIHMDPWWNPAAEDQASDRAHRIGQTRPVTIYRLITRDTIEEKIVELHHRKRELADSLLSGSADADARLSPEELLSLIRG